jgi:outer membrane murein-binding lipoprotein Lpp
MRINKKMGGAIAGALVLGLGVGVAGADDASTIEKRDLTIVEMRAQLSDIEGQLDEARTEIAEAKADAEEADQRADTAKARAERAAKRKFASRERSLDGRARELDDREDAITVAEDAYEAGTIPGDGRLRVGEDVQPGVYQADAPASGNCYWARLGGDSGGIDDIITNGNEAGPATITIEATDHMIELSGCEDFHKVG